MRGDAPQLLSQSLPLYNSTPWLEIGPNVQVIQAAETEFLIRGSWQYTIDLRTKNQLPIAQAQINEIASLLASAVPRGRAREGDLRFPAERDFGKRRDGHLFVQGGCARSSAMSRRRLNSVSIADRPTASNVNPACLCGNAA